MSSFTIDLYPEENIIFEPFQFIGQIDMVVTDVQIGEEKKNSRIALIVISLSQLMIVLDDSIANIALNSIQSELFISNTLLSWIVNAYILAFGTLLLFGGRLGDVYGRRQILRLGLTLFTLSSLVCTLSLNAEMLIISRAIQGVGAALIAPNALGLIASSFSVGSERNRAIAFYGAMSALGLVSGAVLGGLLTGLFSWRMVFLINVPIGFSLLYLSRNLYSGTRHHSPIDVIGASLVILCMFSLNYGITRSTEFGWNDLGTSLWLLAAFFWAVVFSVSQFKQKQPMLPLWLFQDRNRTGTYITMIFAGLGLMGTFYIVALYMQKVLGFDPIQAGVRMLPFSFGIITASVLSTKLGEYIPPRFLAAPGFLIASGGLWWLSYIRVDSHYLIDVLPALFFTSFGLGIVALTLTLTAVYKVSEERSSIASALFNASQQNGAALGIAIFTSISASHIETATNRIHQNINIGANNGDKILPVLANSYAITFSFGAILMLIASFIIVLMVNTDEKQSDTPSI